MRKFSSERLYKFTRAIVIIIAIIAAISAVLGFQEANNATILNNGFSICDRSYPMSAPSANDSVIEKQINEKINEANAKCVQDVINQSNEADKMTSESFLIAVFLPLIFFGGRFIYKYIFPLQKKEKEK